MDLHQLEESVGLFVARFADVTNLSAAFERVRTLPEIRAIRDIDAGISSEAPRYLPGCTARNAAAAVSPAA